MPGRLPRNSSSSLLHLLRHQIPRYDRILDLAAKNDIIIKSGAWYSYHGEKIGQGRENAKKYLTEHPDVFAEVDTAVRAKCLPNASEEEETAEEEKKAPAKKTAKRDE